MIKFGQIEEKYLYNFAKLYNFLLNYHVTDDKKKKFIYLKFEKFLYWATNEHNLLYKNGAPVTSGQCQLCSQADCNIIWHGV